MEDPKNSAEVILQSVELIGFSEFTILFRFFMNGSEQV